MTMAHLSIALLVRPLHVFLRLVASLTGQVFEFGGEWEIHPIAAWIAVGYVTDRLHTRCSSNRVIQWCIPFHCCLWRKFRARWLGPSE
jgi:hypothetical protein